MNSIRVQNHLIKRISPAAKTLLPCRAAAERVRVRKENCIPSSRVVTSVKPFSFFGEKWSLCWRFWCFLPSWVTCFANFCAGTVCEPRGQTEPARDIACLVFGRSWLGSPLF